ncbi:MAG: Loki-CTERM sorting domain-containing protein [Promethearchaeota archaeon]
MVRFYANDTLGRLEFAEVTIRKDVTVPTININSPSPNELFETIAPSFNVEIGDANLDTMWYTLDNGLTNTTFATNETISQALWSVLPDGNVIIIFYANDSAGNIRFTELTIRKDATAPIITINNPQNSDVIGAIAPSFDISIEELNLDTMWYSLNGGNSVTFTRLTGTINQALWDALPEGNVIIRFYANDTLGRIGFQEVTVVKTISQPSPPEIPGYNILFLLGIISTVAIIIVKKRLNRLN